MERKFDLIVIGSGPAGEKAAAKAAYFGYKVALIEKNRKYGGAGVQTGTLPSKTLKETALYLSGIYQKGIFGVDKEIGRETGVHDFLYRKNVVANHMHKTVAHNLKKHGIEVFEGFASFIDKHHIKISGELELTIEGKYILIATGSYPYHPEHIPFDNKRVLDSDTVLNIKRFPKSICVLGAGVIGCEYATIFGAMGVKTFIVNDHDKILGFLDSEISEALVEQMRKNEIKILFKNSVTEFEIPEDEQPLRLTLRSGEILNVDMFLFAAGRSGQIKGLNCEEIGLKTGKRETVLVNDKFQTNIDNIYAVGDVIGFPALASTSMEQGRIAITHMFNTADLESLADIFPYGIYTVPEVSMVGITEEEAKKEEIDYGVGYSYFRDTARGMIMGDTDNGYLKLIFDKNTKVIVGVHIIGHLATELIHYGMQLVQEKKTLDHLIATVFNYPTLHGLYKYASYDGLGNIAGKKVKTAGEVIK
ncbi:Si-specific NAD(P)(+) transhydrogenase [Aquimarina sp. 2201CG5-10]|uniref:Si-specific NAD(P)(+) transhydrogenase n=1 Tax=Aquimarina callyspongiae TaxID=3098150 RepID=UPI002AB519FC|nr:Si-specific NAD(P)(+) transhydrogenase [Aquimarina sp. 2201CG5-10]MDY8136134.1 Si-specific NAD(P)(+) transhydrogenase [Aquimarina sp. 2201CG5-10]